MRTCIVHLIRDSPQFASWKERKVVAAARKPISHAATAEIAAQQLQAFDTGEWGCKYPSIAKSWRRNLQHVIPFFDFPEAIRKTIYMTHAIESLNRSVRKEARRRGHFPSDKAAAKLIDLALRNVEANWKKPPITWRELQIQFAIAFEEPFIINQ